MSAPQIFQMEDVAARLSKSRRWLQGERVLVFNLSARLRQLNDAIKAVQGEGRAS